MDHSKFKQDFTGRASDNPEEMNAIFFQDFSTVCLGLGLHFPRFSAPQNHRCCEPGTHWRSVCKDLWKVQVRGAGCWTITRSTMKGRKNLHPCIWWYNQIWIICDIHICVYTVYVHILVWYGFFILITDVLEMTSVTHEVRHFLHFHMCPGKPHPMTMPNVLISGSNPTFHAWSRIAEWHSLCLSSTINQRFGVYVKKRPTRWIIRIVVYAYIGVVQGRVDKSRCALSTFNFFQWCRTFFWMQSHTN